MNYSNKFYKTLSINRAYNITTGKEWCKCKENGVGFSEVEKLTCWKFLKDKKVEVEPKYEDIIEKLTINGLI